MALAVPTTSEVRSIISSPKDDTFVAMMIDDAVLFLENIASVVAASESMQKAIVRWVTAHLISVSNSGQLTQKSIGDATDSYASNSALFGPGLRSTTFGQRALALDPNLINVGLRPIIFRAV